MTKSIDYVYEIEQAIRDLAAKAASMRTHDTPLDTSSQRGWWVLAVGDRLDPHSFDQREHTRDALRRELLKHNIRLVEYVWVWDETNHAQVVLRTFEKRELAETFAAAIAKRGLRVRVAREWDTEHIS